MIKADNSIQPCFSAFAAGGIQPIASIYYNQLFDCLQSCINNVACQSVVWDQATYYCYHFSQTARTNPALLLNRQGSAYYEKAGSCGGNTGPVVTQQTPTKQTCPLRNATAYFVITEVELAATGSSQTIPYDQENQCVTACTEQTSTVDGKPVPCSSFTALPKNRQCVITDVAAKPDGTGVLRPNPDAVYLQKFCVPSNAPSTCFEQFFFLFPGQNLDGHTISTVKATSLQDCAGQCVSNGGCKAGVYDAGTNDCILKNDNAINFKADLKPDSANTFYFENGCLLGARPSGGLFERLARIRLSKKSEVILDTNKLESVQSEWSAWSPCQYNIAGKRSRVRTRNCASLPKCPDKDIEYKHCAV
jgi:hypothetical protein